MRILPAGPKQSAWKGFGDKLHRLLHPPATEMEFMEAVVTAERERQYKKAVRLCDRGLQKFPGDFYLLMKRLAQSRDSGDRNLGQSLLERAVTFCPETAATFCSVGEEYAYLGKMDEAEAFFRRAVERTPSNPLLREKLAMALVSQKKWDEGIKELTTAFNAEPANSARRELLARVLLQSERFAEVVDLLEEKNHEPLSWESLMCLSAAQARLDGANQLADQLLHPGSGKNDRE